MLDKLSDGLQYTSELLKLRAKRQQVLVANIINVDTPNYKAVDFNFAKALKSATAGQGPFKQMGGVGVLKTHASHLGSSSKSSVSTDALLKFRRNVRASLDNNTVDIEMERAAYAENTVKYEAALRSINGRLSALKRAMDAQR